MLTDTERVKVPVALFEMTVANAQLQGWKVIKNDGEEALLRWKGNSGSLVNHLLVGVLTLPTMGLGNIAYGAGKKAKTTKMLRIIAVY